VEKIISALRRISFSRFTAFLVSAFACFGIFGVFGGIGHPSVFDPNFNAPWTFAIGEMKRLGLLFGQDVISTLGPLSTLFGSAFARESFWWAAGFQVATAVTVAAMVFLLLNKRSGPSAWGPAAIAMLFMVRDVYLLLPPFLLVLLRTTVPNLKWRALVTITCATVTAALSLTKFSAVPIALLCFGLVDFMDLRARLIPVALMSYVAALLAGYGGLEGQLSGLFSYLRYSAELSSGYNEAMSLAGYNAELFRYLALAGFFCTAAFFIEVSNVRQGRIDKASAAVLGIALSAFVFVTFKIGFVRPWHSMIAWSGLAVAMALYAAARPHVLAKVFQFLSIAIVLVLLPWEYRKDLPVLQYHVDALSRAPQQAIEAALLVFKPEPWLAAAQERKQNHYHKIQSDNPLPALAGSVDSIGVEESVVIAHDFVYRPRFSFEEFVTCTSSLIEKNRNYLAGEEAVDNILFRPSSLDGRHPALTEGPLWPILIQRYVVSVVVRDVAILQRRQEPILDVLGPATMNTIELQQPVRLPESPVFLKAAIELGYFGKLMNFFFRVPQIYIQVSFQDGTTKRYRLVRAIAREGFVVSPLVEDARGYSLFVEGIHSPELKFATGITIETNSWGLVVYDHRIKTEMFPILVNAERRSPER
jgi:hypothetical protein